MSVQMETRAHDGGVQAVYAALAERFGNRASRGADILNQHAHTLSVTPSQPPDLVVWPLNSAEVQEIVRLCAAHRVPVIPFGTGTSLEGHVNAPMGGVCVDLSKMNQIEAVHA